MIPLFLLASRRDQRIVQEFWTHLASLRRRMPGVIFVEPVYGEDLRQGQALIPASPEHFLLIGCCSPTFLSLIFEQPALREWIVAAEVKVPFPLSPCSWDTYPSPFAGYWSLVKKPVSLARRPGERDQMLAQAAQNVEKLLKERT